MTITIISTNFTTVASEDPAVEPASGDIVIVEAGAIAAADGPLSAGIDGMNETEVQAQIDGTVASGEFHGVILGASQGGGFNTVNIGAAGRVLAYADGVRLFGANNRLTNEGLINSGGDGLYLGHGPTGTGNGIVLNSGTITANGTGMAIEGTNHQITNTGTISSVQDAMFLDGDGLIRNTGTITSAGAYGIIVDNNLGGTTEIYNGGLISAGSFAIRAYSDHGTFFGAAPGIEIVRNTGTLDGDVDLHWGDDVFDGRGGTVTGRVMGGRDDDTYIIDDASIRLVELANEGEDTVQTEVSFALPENVENLVLLGADDIDGTGTDRQNVLTGNAGQNRLSGGNSRDTIDGGAGADDIDGGVGNDVLFGGTGDDAMAGRAGNDLMMGGDDDDLLFGGLGADRMLGEDGNDTLKGGLGSDTMDGGAGQDVFVFTRVSDSLGGQSDIIQNFTPGEDILDFTGLGTAALDINILGGFTGGGQASLRTHENSYGDTVVFVDADGDGGTDMRIEIDGVTFLTEADFLA